MQFMLNKIHTAINKGVVNLLNCGKIEEKNVGL